MEMPRSPLVYIGIVFLCLCIVSSCYSQEWDDVLSLLNDEFPEDYDEDSYSALEDLYYTKFNVNELSEEDCSKFVFLSDFEKQSLLYYVSHNKPLFSIYELQFVLGLPAEKMKILSQFLYASPTTVRKPLSDLIEEGRHTLALNVSAVNIPKEEYKDFNHYDGGPNKEIFRYRFSSYNDLFWGITMKKDMGETFSKEGFDSRSMYVQIKNRKVLSNLILGDYKISIAQGLILSQGGGFGSSLEQPGGSQSYVLTKHSSTSEYIFSRGCGMTVKLGKFQVTPFASFRNLDGHISDKPDFPFVISKTGYHRTLSEQASREQISYTLTGLHIVTDLNRWKVGCAVLRHSFEKDTVSATIANASLFYNYFRRHTRLFGEFATDHDFNIATVNGIQHAICEELTATGVFRYYGKSYQSFMSSAVGRKSSIANETGFDMNLRVVVSPKTTLIVGNDVFYFPAEQSTVKIPTQGNALKVKLSYKTFSGMSAYYQLSYLRQTKSVENGYNMMPKYSHKFYFSRPLTRTLQLKAMAQAVYGNDAVGIMIYEDIVWKPNSQLTISCRTAQFDAPFDNRLYAWEDDVQYIFANSQMFYAGTKTYAVLKWKIAKRFIAQSKIAYTKYTDKYDLPDSYDLYTGNGKIQVNLLLQIEL